MIMITGDAMARPLIEALDDPTRADPTCRRWFAIEQHRGALLAVGEGRSSGALPERGPDRRDRLVRGRLERVHDRREGQDRDEGRPDGHGRSVDNVVLDDDLEVVAGVRASIGKVARKGNIPLEYYKDPVKTAETFVTGADGVRYAIPGDFATVEADGTITLLGRGSVSINSGGEKIFPEEVEGAVKSPPRGLRLRRRRRARRALGPARRRRRAAARRARRRRSSRSRSTAARRSPATSCPASCTSSTRSCAPRAASPTTAGPHRRPRRDHARLIPGFRTRRHGPATAASRAPAADARTSSGRAVRPKCSRPTVSN